MNKERNCENCTNKKRQIIIGAYHPVRYYPWVCVECLAHYAERKTKGEATRPPYNWEEDIMVRMRPDEKRCKFCGHCEYEGGEL